jgi:hypothetical protein
VNALSRGASSAEAISILDDVGEKFEEACAMFGAIRPV